MARFVPSNAPDLKTHLLEHFVQVWVVIDEPVLAVHPEVHVERLYGFRSTELAAAPARMPSFGVLINTPNDRRRVRREQSHDSSGLQHPVAFAEKSEAFVELNVLQKIF